MNLNSGANEPPTPPTRRHSLRQPNGAQQPLQHTSQTNISSGYNSSASSNSGGESFEARFQHRFKTPQFLPPPEPYANIAKTYPSRSAAAAANSNNGGARMYSVKH